jgi:hypothetical protein
MESRNGEDSGVAQGAPGGGGFGLQELFQLGKANMKAYYGEAAGGAGDNDDEGAGNDKN